MNTSMLHSFIKSTSFGKRHLVLFLAIVIGITCSALSALPGWHAGAQASVNDQIAFDRGGNITLINSNGAGMVSHGPGFGPSFSPDGTQIVFSFRNVDAVAISKMNADGTGRVQLTELRQQSLAAWSPDGAKIAFVSEREDPEYQPGDDLYTTERLYLMDTNGDNPKKLMTRAQSHTGTHMIKREFAPAWSPDGSQLAFIGFTSDASGSSRENLYVVSRDGSGLREVTHFDGASLVTSKISWSRDGTKIAFGMNRDIYLVTIDGLSQPINLSNTTDREERDPAFSPGGGWIAYVMNHIDNLQDGLYIMKADGQNPTQILSSSAATDQQVNHPAWNPLAQDPESQPGPSPSPSPSPEADMSIGMTAQPAAPKVGETVVYQCHRQKQRHSQRERFIRRLPALCESGPRIGVIGAGRMSTVGLCAASHRLQYWRTRHRCFDDRVYRRPSDSHRYGWDHRHGGRVVARSECGEQLANAQRHSRGSAALRSGSDERSSAGHPAPRQPNGELRHTHDLRAEHLGPLPERVGSLRVRRVAHDHQRPANGKRVSSYALCGAGWSPLQISERSKFGLATFRYH